MARFPVEDPAMVAFLREDWCGLLEREWRLHGGESPQWRESQALTERLIWSLAPKQGNRERQELLQAIPELLKRLRRKLDADGYDPHRMRTLFRQIQLLHNRMFHEQGGNRAATGGHEPDTPLVPVPVAIEVNEIAVGARVLHQAGEGVTNLLKLAWRSPVTGRCLFVDQRGELAMELSGMELAAFLASGRLVVSGGDRRPAVPV